MWLGSTDTMCGRLDEQLHTGRSSGDGITATVKAKPRAIIRSAAGKSASVAAYANAGQTGIVTCYAIGDTVTSSRGPNHFWDRVPAGVE